MHDPVGRLLIVRLGSLGDLVHTLPAVAAIRRAHPHAVIDWFVDQAHRDFLDLVSVLSSVVVLRRPTLAGWLDARRELRRRQYEVAIDFQGLVKSAVLARASGAKRVIGFGRRSTREPLAGLFYTESVEGRAGEHVIQKNLRLATAVGAPVDRVEFPLAVPTSATLDQIRADIGATFAVCNPGAAWPNKRWPAERFGHIARWLHETHGLRTVVLWGPGEGDLASAVVAASGGTATAAPPTRLHDLVAIMSAARLLVSGDTGPTHIGGAVGVPIVALFGPTKAERNGPWAPGDVAISRYDTCGCHYQRACRREAAGWCLGTVTEDEVKRAITARMEAVRAS